MRSRPIRVLLATLGLVAAVTSVAAQEARRGIPRRLREGLVGCFVLPEGETYVIEPRGASGLRSRWRASRAGGPVETHSDAMLYRPELDAVEAGCGPRTVHSQTCLFSLDDAGTVHVVRVSSYSGRATALAVAPCEAGTAVPAARPLTHPIPADAPASALLRARLRDIEATRAATGEEAGWRRYGDDLAVLYEAGVAMRVRVRVGALSCEDAARAAGFSPTGSAPLRRREGCEWPGLSERHRLAPGIAASYANGIFEAWIR